MTEDVKVMTEDVKVMTEGVDVISLDRAYLWRRGEGGNLGRFEEGERSDR